MFNDDDIENSISKDKFFSPLRLPKSKSLVSLVDDIIGNLLTYEALTGARKKARKAADNITFRRIVQAIICDLVHNHLRSPERLICISQSKTVLGVKGRYKSPIMSETLPSILKNLASPELSFVNLKSGHWVQGSAPNVQSTIECGTRLSSRVNQYQITLDDLCEDYTHESIILKSTKETRYDSSEWIDYVDTEQTIKYRSDLLEINAWLQQADILCDDGGKYDTTKRLLRRVFNNKSFDYGGRFFGGFWQNMKKHERSEYLSMDGEQVITLDYSQTAATLAYGLCNVKPKGDAYTLPSGRYSRDAIKKVFAAMLYTSKIPVKFPRESKPLFLKTDKFSDVRDEIFSYHEPIKHLLCTGEGLRLMVTESNVLMDALLECKKQEIFALPVHDALIVAESKQSIVKEIMLTSLLKVAGTEGRVEVE